MQRNALGLWPLLLAAMLAARESQYERAVRMIAALTIWRERHGLAHDNTLWTKVLPKHEPDAVLKMASAALGDAAARNAWAEGSALSLEAAMDEAQAENAHSPVADKQPEPPHRARTPGSGAVGRGLTNRKIGERLVITEGTAKVHVGRVLAKLDLHSRAQLAAWAVQHNLIEPANALA